MNATALSRLGQRTSEPPITWLMHIALARPQLISLAAGFTDSESLPLEDARRLLDDILGSTDTGLAALQYGTTAGDLELRRLTGARLRQLDQAAVAAGITGAGRGSRLAGAAVRENLYSPERLFITSGSQQLLYTLSESLCDPGDIVLVEDPTYFVFLGIIQSHGLRCCGIRLTEEGLDLDALESALAALKRSGELRRLKLLYLVSYFQNPTGITTSWERKAAALETLRRYERAAGHPIYLVEDAAYRELRFAGPDEPSALTVRGCADRVIYGGTFSKPFATGVRVGFGVLPPTLLRVVLRVKANHDFGTSNLLQQLIQRALASGRYQAHLPILQRRYARKAATLVQAMREHFPKEVQWIDPRGGLYVWARLPRSIRTGMRSRLFSAALDHEVLYVPGELCYGDDPMRRRPTHEMRLSFGGARDQHLREGIKRLGSALRGFGLGGGSRTGRLVAAAATA